MAAITTAVVGTAVAVKGQRDQKKAQQNAANEQRQASIESANILDQAGRAAEADIMRQNALAIESAQLAAIEAGEQIQPFADTTAFKQAQDEIIGNLPVSGAIADSIREASTEFIRNRPEFDLSGPVGAEVERQGDLAVSAASPQFRDSLVAAGQQGLAAATDLGQIEQRGLQRLGDIAGGQATQRASVLVGQTPQLTQLATGAREAGLLSDVAGQQFRTSAAESIAGLGGQLLDSKAGLLRRDEFGLRPTQDPFDTGNF